MNVYVAELEACNPVSASARLARRARLHALGGMHTLHVHLHYGRAPGSCRAVIDHAGRSSHCLVPSSAYGPTRADARTRAKVRQTGRHTVTGTAPVPVPRLAATPRLRAHMSNPALALRRAAAKQCLGDHFDDFLHCRWLISRIYHLIDQNVSEGFVVNAVQMFPHEAFKDKTAWKFVTPLTVAK